MERPRIQHVDHIAVRVSEPEALAEFFTNVLGLERKGTSTRALFSLPGGITIAVFPIGANQGGISERTTSLVPDHIAITVDDFAAMKAFLESKGYEFDGDMMIAPGGLCLQFVE
ncbi:VOC family protein [Sulfobacillus thermosulfidooxidans]|uniref:VOC family protein n=1 Tax=Sulfobacillus thermosulfidooxidans TaxID=28034 RepID=UPI0006B69492|nr:VOC family protein [Sulfobacillus thermosulfidooxidans]